MSQRPLAVSLLLCEMVIVEDRTKCVTPVNCFSRWFIEGSLSEPQSFHAMAVLTSGHGNVAGALVIERLDTGETVFRRDFSIHLEDPVQQYPCLVRLRRIKFPVVGAYQALLLMDEESIASTRFFVSLKE